MKERKSHIKRTTFETDIDMILNLDGEGEFNVNTGIGFFDHMLNSFAKHGNFDLDVNASGDLEVDCHHTIEDTGIVLGQAIKEAVGDKAGIKRYASFIMPMDEALILVSVDISGRPYFSYDLKLTAPKVGDFDTQMTREFFYAVSYSAGMNLHIKQLDGINDHHIIEATFKAFANALSEAVSIDKRLEGKILSTKGAL